MNISLIEAEIKHSELLFKWANDKVVRLNSFNKDEIKYVDHEKWFNDKLNSISCNIFICYLNNDPVGQVRIDIDNDTATISYSIDSNFRGRGLSSQMISLLEKKVQNNIHELIGYVKYNNIISQKVFEKLGYNKYECKEFIKYCKLI